MSAPLLAQALAGDIFFAFIAAIAFATILAVVAGLTISASTSFAHDFYTAVIHKGTERRPGEEVRVARITAFVVGAVAIGVAILLGKDANVAFLVALAFAVAASANLPVIVFSLFWKRFNTTGAVLGLATGLIASLALIIISPSIMKVDPPGIVGAARHLIQRAADIPAGKPRHPQHSARVSGGDPRHAAGPGATRRSEVRRAERPGQYRLGCGKTDVESKGVARTSSLLCRGFLTAEGAMVVRRAADWKSATQRGWKPALQGRYKRLSTFGRRRRKLQLRGPSASLRLGMTRMFHPDVLCLTNS